MIYLIAGTTHTGKTVLAQKLLERYHVPYLSIDHLKMGLIRSGRTALTPMDGLIRDNGQNLALCRQYGCEFVLIDEDYPDSLEEIYDHPAV
jgi:hypothetical protein